MSFALVSNLGQLANPTVKLAEAIPDHVRLNIVATPSQHVPYTCPEHHCKRVSMQWSMCISIKPILLPTSSSASSCSVVSRSDRQSPALLNLSRSSSLLHYNSKILVLASMIPELLSWLASARPRRPRSTRAHNTSPMLD